MEKSVSGFRDSFYQDLLCEYNDEGVDSILYQYFWTESVAELLEKCSLQPSGPLNPKDDTQVREQLRNQVKERQDLLPIKAPEKDQEKLWSFWEALWLNGAGHQAGVISDTDCYLWLVNYLAKHGIYYKDTSLWDGRLWLDALLRQGLPDGDRPGYRILKTGKKKGQSVFSTVQIGRDLKKLAEEIQCDRAKIEDRLSRLPKDYLPWLTRQLEQMALHIKIKDWLQYSGYPLVKDESKKRKKRSAKRPQKQDSTMRLLEAYFDSGRGSLFRGADQRGSAAVKGWQLDGSGYCVMEMDKIEALQKALEQSKETCFYIPLAVDPRSGCVFFLAGKEIYEKVYQIREENWKKAYTREAEACSRAKENYLNAKKQFVDKKTLEQIYYTAKEKYKAAEKGYTAAVEARKAYEASPARCCFDFLRLDRPHLKRFLGNPAGSFQLMPAFHKNAGESCQSILGEFKRYCEARSKRYPYSPPNAIKEFNQEAPAGIPEEFIWAFGDPEGEEPVCLELSPEAIDSFRDSRAKPLQAPGIPPQKFRN